jgi:nicotinate-nucleotide--dimethylbenzimidazole phosphoribosyltransferase
MDTDFASALKQSIDSKTKPIGSLGRLEDLAFQIGCIQQSLTPRISRPTVVIFAGDHGIAAEGVSAYSQSVTAQMVRNFLTGGAAINVFCSQNKIHLQIVDAGVAQLLPPHSLLKSLKVGLGTRNFVHEPAMTGQECDLALRHGAEIVQCLGSQMCNLIGFGEMGIGNTSSASAILHLLSDLPLELCVGRGTGLNDHQLQKKIRILENAIQNKGNLDRTPLNILATFGGFEIAMMVGAYLEAARSRMVILVDGFIASVALLVASRIDLQVLKYCVFSHLSDEPGHAHLLKMWNASPLLKLNLRLGEGTGVALSYPIVQAAVNFLNEMATFETAQVSLVDAL